MKIIITDEVIIQNVTIKVIVMFHKISKPVS